MRCPAAPLALANAVIAHNKRRSAKRLQLTKGFGGKTAVYADKTIPSMSKHIIKNILELKQTGTPLHDIAVLVRLNAQTPHIEQELITHKIPYRVSKPFYDQTIDANRHVSDHTDHEYSIQYPQAAFHAGSGYFNGEPHRLAGDTHVGKNIPEHQK